MTNITPLQHPVDLSLAQPISCSPLERISRYVQSCIPSYTAVPQTDVAPIDFDARSKQLEAQRTEEANIRDKTLCWRVKGQDLGLPENEKEMDFIVGICDGQLRYSVSEENLRSMPKGAATQVVTAMGLAAAGLGAYVATGEGIVTKGLTTSLCSFVLPKLVNIPYLPQVVGPVAVASGAYMATQLFDSNSYVKFTFVAGLGLCALLYKRGGKALSTGGWAAFKKYVIPMGFTETSARALPTRILNWFRNTPAENGTHLEYGQNHQVVATLPIEPVRLENQVNARLELTTFDNDMFYTLILGQGENEKRFPPIKMASKDDDDDDDEDVEKTHVKTKQKKAEKPALSERMKEGSLLIVSGCATALSNRYLGQGITTTAVNSIFSASVKAKFRLLPFFNSYGILTLATGALLVVKYLSPNSLVGDLYFMPMSILTSLVTKDIKDRIVNGKEPKNTDLYEVPVIVKKIGNQLLGWCPAPVLENTDPFKMVLDESNKGVHKIVFPANLISPDNPSDKQIQAALKISSKKLTGAYKLSKKDKKELHLSRLKAKKLGPKPEAAFIITSIGATLLASYLTKKYQEGTFTDAVQIKAQDLGEGVVTTMLNSVLSTYLKQFGKKLPPIPRDGGLLLTAVGAIALERVLMDSGELPFLFSSIPTSGFLAIQSKKAKQWVYGKPYGKTEGWVTKKWPTDENLQNGWDSLKKTAQKILCCKKEELKEELSKLPDDELLLMREDKGKLEVLVQ